MPEVVPVHHEADGHMTIDVRDAKEAEAKGVGPPVLNANEFGMATASKEEGNEHFRAGRLKDACVA